jgi:hypothetical protein
MPATVIRLVDGYDDEPDCAIVTLAMYLDCPYPEVIRAVAALARGRGCDGLTRHGFVRVAAHLGHTLRKRRVDPVNGYGILFAPGHAAVLLQGRVLDRLTNWPLKEWLADQKCKLTECDFFVAVDE